MRGQLWKDNLRDYGLLGSLLLIVAFFYFITADHASVAPVNITNLVMQNSYVVIMALGMLLIIVGGNIDLSVGSIVGFVGAIGGVADRLPEGALPARDRDLPRHGGAHRRRAGLPRRLRQDAVLHRDARRHADLPRPHRQSAAGAVRRAVPEGLPEHRLRLPARHHRHRRTGAALPEWAQIHWVSLLLGVVGALAMFVSSFRRWRRAKLDGMEVEPLPLLIGKNLVFAAIIVGIAWNLAQYKGLPDHPGHHGGR